MQISEKQLFDAVVSIVAGVVSNPANAYLSKDQYGLQQALATSINAVSQAIYQIGGSIVPNAVLSGKPPHIEF